MFYSAVLATKAVAYRRFGYTTLSAVLLLSVASSAQAMTDNNVYRDASRVNAIARPDNYCQANIETLPFYTKNQSTRQHVMNCMLMQLPAYQQKDMTSRQQYLAYKAQAWLNYAYHEDSIKSRTAAGTYALREATTILSALKEGTDEGVPLTPNIPKTSALMRPDLWATLNAIKDNGGFASAPRELAFSEVSLVWAAADHCEHGWRVSASNFRMANRWLEQAREAYANANDAQTNIALDNAIMSYYEQYAPLDPNDDICRGQVLSLIPDVSRALIDNRLPVVQPIPMPVPTATYRLAY